MPVPLRNPALVAMEIATIARLFPDRFVPALGHGVLDWMAQVGARAESPMTLLREHTVAVRDLLDGRRVEVEGRYVRLDGVALDWPPATPPPCSSAPAATSRSTSPARSPTASCSTGSATPTPYAGVGGWWTRDGTPRPAGSRTGHALHGGRLGPPAGCVAAQVGERITAFREAGADTVVLQATGGLPDPRPLVEALAANGLLT